MNNYISKIIGVSLLVGICLFQVTCKKTEVNNASSGRISEESNDYNEETGICVEIEGPWADEAFFVSEQEDLNDILENTTYKDYRTIYFEGDTVILTGEGLSGSGYNDHVAIFTGWNGLNITSADPNNPTTIIFKPRHTTESWNRRMFAFYSCSEVWIHDLHIYVDVDNVYNIGSGTTNLTTPIHETNYLTSLISFMWDNHDVEVWNMKIQGANPTATYNGNQDPIDFWIAGAISSGYGIDPSSGTNLSQQQLNAYTRNSNICVRDNIIRYFRIYGFSMNYGDDFRITDNDIQYIWEAALSFKSEAGGIHCKYVDGLDIRSNYIRGVYSLWPAYGSAPDSNYHETHQHGIYISSDVNDAVLDDNEIIFISASGIEINSEGQTAFTVDGSIRQNITVSNNDISYTMNKALAVNAVENLYVYGNTFEHCMQNFAGHPAYNMPTTCIATHSSAGMIGIEAAVENMEFHDNVILNAIPEVYEPSGAGVYNAMGWYILSVYDHPGWTSYTSTINSDLADTSKCYNNQVYLYGYDSSVQGAVCTNSVFLLVSLHSSGTRPNKTIEEIQASSASSAFTFKDFSAATITCP